MRISSQSNGPIWTWGNNAKGTLANATMTSSDTPTEVAHLSGMNLVAAGGFHSLALATASPATTTTTYGYDSLYRLTSVNDPSGTTNDSYDPVGNRLSKVLNGTTSYFYDKADRILTAWSINYTVNANGNVTARGNDSFAYDQANRLTNATIGGTTWNYQYDGDGKRTSQTLGTTSLTYLYDDNGSLFDVLSDGTYTYVYGVGLAYAADANGNLQVYHTDGLGSVRAISDNNGNVIETYQTDAFGVPTQTQGSSAQSFQFTGQQVDDNGLLYLRARYYDPTVGRFLSRDSQFGNILNPTTLNRVAYARDNPLLFFDPSGHVAFRQAQAVCAAEGLSCENLTHDMAVELLNGNGKPIDWTDPSILTI